MADPVTSGIKPTEIGEGKDKKTIYTATKVTPTTDENGKTTYKMEVIQYDDANGGGGRTIGTRDGDKITYNNNASEDITENKEVQNKINKDSQDAASKINPPLATTAEEKAAFNKANGSPNQGSEEDKPTATVAEATAALNAAAGESADGTRNKFPVLTYPATLRKDVDAMKQDYIKFDMLEYKPKEFDSESFAFADRDSNRKSIGSVVLPIPGGIQDSTAVSWGGQTMTPLDMVAAEAAFTGVSKGIGEMVSAFGNRAQGLAGAVDSNKDALAAVIAGMAAGGQQLLTRTTGAIANPNMELLFNGPDLRTFSFQFLLAPRDQDEAMTTIKILRFFKQGMAPIRTKARLFMKSPHTFRLSYNNPKGGPQKYLNKFKECALGSFGVNYTPNGNYSTYEDGVMTAYQMTMTFRELKPIYNDDYGNQDEFPEEVGF